MIKNKNLLVIYQLNSIRLDKPNIYVYVIVRNYLSVTCIPIFFPKNKLIMISKT